MTQIVVASYKVLIGKSYALLPLNYSSVSPTPKNLQAMPHRVLKWFASKWKSSIEFIY